MSRSWLEKRLSPIAQQIAQVGRIGHVTTLHLGRGTDAGAEQRDAQQPSWQAALLVLQQDIESRKERLSRRVKIVVANRFVRYVLVPWTDQRLSAAERVELARTLFVERYGERDAAWHIALEAERFEAPALAAAIDADLVAALQALCGGAGLRLVSMPPALIENLRQQRRLLNKTESGWFVDGSDGRMAVLAFCNGEWAQVSNEPGADLLPLLRRDAIRVPGLLDGKVFVANMQGDMETSVEAIAQSWPLVRLARVQSSALLEQPLCA